MGCTLVPWDPTGASQGPATAGWLAGWPLAGWLGWAGWLSGWLGWLAGLAEYLLCRN